MYKEEYSIKRIQIKNICIYSSYALLIEIYIFFRIFYTNYLTYYKDTFIIRVDHKEGLDVFWVKVSVILVIKFKVQKGD